MPHGRACNSVHLPRLMSGHRTGRPKSGRTPDKVPRQPSLSSRRRTASALDVRVPGSRRRCLSVCNCEPDTSAVARRSRTPCNRRGCRRCPGCSLACTTCPAARSRRARLVLARERSARAVVRAAIAVAVGAGAMAVGMREATPRHRSPGSPWPSSHRWPDGRRNETSSAGAEPGSDR